MMNKVIVPKKMPMSFMFITFLSMVASGKERPTTVIIGIGIGAAIHGYVPSGFFEAYLSGEHWYAVPLAVVLAVPMYANAAGIVPVVQVFVAKGVALGTALAFMMSVVGLSLPEATMLKKVMNMKLIGIFFGTIALFIILLGWLFNMVL